MLWYKHGDIAFLQNIGPREICCLDIETTGLNPHSDEVLQLAVIDGQGNTLMNRYFQPTYQNSSKRTECLCNVNAKPVCSKQHLNEIREYVENLFNGVKLLVGYNLAFDLSFLAAADIKMPDLLCFDVMQEFAPVLHRRSNSNGFRWWSLSVCAQYYGITYRPHEALEDAQATLACFQRMILDNGTQYHRCGAVPYLRVVERYHA